MSCKEPVRPSGVQRSEVRRSGLFSGVLGLIVGVVSAVAGLLAILDHLRPRERPRDEGLTAARTSLSYAALGLAPLSLLARRPLLALLAAPAGVRAVQDLRERREMPVPPKIQPVRELTILTHNLEGAEDVDDVLRLARTGNADVVAVQGLGPVAQERLRLNAQGEYAFVALEGRDDAHAGVGILSRHPILTQEYWPYRPGEAAHGNLRAEVRVGTARVAIYNVHPPAAHAAPASALSEALDGILTRVAAERGPLVVVGDLNAGEDSEVDRRLTERLTDAWREVMRPRAAEEQAPALQPERVGRILHSQHLQVVWLRTGEPRDGAPVPAWASLILPLPEEPA